MIFNVQLYSYTEKQPERELGTSADKRVPLAYLVVQKPHYCK
jgi:hypothetical protein